MLDMIPHILAAYIVMSYAPRGCLKPQDNLDQIVSSDRNGNQNTGNDQYFNFS